VKLLSWSGTDEEHDALVMEGLYDQQPVVLKLFHAKKEHRATREDTYLRLLEPTNTVPRVLWKRDRLLCMTPVGISLPRVIFTFASLLLEIIKDDAKVEKMYQDFVRKLATPLANAVKRIHDLNVIHKDIKPDNIILTPDLKSFLIIDFEFSVLHPSKDADSSGGTMPYQSENAARGGKACFRDDYVALCYTLAAISIGQQTWEGGARFANEPPPISDIINMPVVEPVVKLFGKENIV